MSAAGQVGFRIPQGATEEDRCAYEKLGQIQWTPALKAVGHYGGHTTWASVGFLRQHLPPMLRGEPLLDVRGVPNCLT